MSVLTREALFSLLDRRLDDAALGSSQDRDIWSQCGTHRAVLVIDLSGFTRITRARGILHFLAVYRRATLMTLPVFEAHGGRCVKTVADNVIAVFAEPKAAVAASREIVARSRELTERLPPDDWAPPCVGIGYGHILELQDDIFGDEVNIAFKLGEDVALAHQILLSEPAYAKLGGEAAEAKIISLGGLDVRYFVLG